MCFRMEIKTYHGNFMDFRYGLCCKKKKTYSVFSNLKKAYQENILCFYYPWRNANKGQCHQ